MRTYLAISGFLPDIWRGVRNSQGDIRLDLDVIVKLVANATQLVMFIAGIAAVVMIIVGGIRYITSSGSPDALAGAKKTIANAVIGLVLISMAYSIVAIIVLRLE